MARSRQLRLSVAGVMLAGYWLALFVATHIPMRGGPGGHGLDKLYHAVAYAGLAFLLATVHSVVGRPSWRSYVAVFLLIAGYGALDEWIQLHIPTRNANVLDWYADLIGGVIGLASHAFFLSIAHWLTRSWHEAAGESGS